MQCACVCVCISLRISLLHMHGCNLQYPSAIASMSPPRTTCHDVPRGSSRCSSRCTSCLVARSQENRMEKPGKSVILLVNHWFLDFQLYIKLSNCLSQIPWGFQDHQSSYMFTPICSDLLNVLNCIEPRAKKKTTTFDPGSKLMTARSYMRIPSCLQIAYCICLG